MGWTGTNKGQKSTKEFFIDEFGYTKDNGDYGKVIDVKSKGNVSYLAYKTKRGETITVSAIVCRTSRSRGYYNFSYKNMHENEHPYFYDCPKSILDLLTPTENEAANRWRELCHERLNKNIKVKNGDVIKFENKFRFGKFGQDDTFKCSDPKRGIYYAMNICIAVKLTKKNLLDYNFTATFNGDN